MATRALPHILILCVFSTCTAQFDRRWGGMPLGEGFLPFEDYFYGHHRNPKALISLEPRFIVLAPNLLRTDSKEHIYLEAQGQSSPITVIITAYDFPSRSSQLLVDTVQLNQDNKFHTLKTIELHSKDLGRDETTNKFIYLRADFGAHRIEKVVMVSFQSGYIFIQTDKPLYNPGDSVRCRAFVSTPAFQAFNSSITFEIQNAEGIVVKQISRTRAQDGYFADIHTLSEMVNEGMWKITAKFDHWQQNTFSADFEVKKYVLPAFNVTLTPKKSFLSLDDTELEVEISASYLYGEPVSGTAYIVFGVEVNNEKRRLPSAVKQVTDLNQGTVKLTMDEIKKAYPNLREIVGCSIYVKASVLTTSGSDLVEAEKSGIKIVESLYIISFKDTRKYFKPGLPFDLNIEVNHHDGSPARNVPVQLTLKSDVQEHLRTMMHVGPSGTLRTSLNMPEDLRPQSIIAKTQQEGLRPEQQATQQMTLYLYSPFSRDRRNYLYISGSNLASPGENLNLKLHIKATDTAHRELVTHLTYLVLNKGRIIIAKRLDVTGQEFTIIPLRVTTEMIPSFRFVAFYTIPWAGLVEVVADSIWVDVEDACVGSLSVGYQGLRPPEYYRPGKRFNLEVRGDPGAKVSLVAVDNAVFLLNKQRLTQRKIWDTVESADMGCTRGGGGDNMGVFTNAGLLFYSNNARSTDPREDLQCPRSARRRRSAEMLQRRAQLETHYKEKLLRRCCKDGLRDVPMPYTCTRRSLYITEGWECVRAFRYCCSRYRNEEFDPRPPPTTVQPTTLPPTTTPPPRPTNPFYYLIMASAPRRDFEPESEMLERRIITSVSARVFQTDSVIQERRLHSQLGQMRPYVDEDEDEEGFTDERDVTLRSKFYESWLWTDLWLPSIPDSKDGLASLPFSDVLPDTITEWGVIAISSSPVTGFCVAEPYNMRTWRRFFVDLKLPYSVARHEHVEVKAVLHNYGTEAMDVKVVLLKTEDMCSVAFNERHTQDVNVPAGSSLVVPYTIVPLKAGKLLLEVMALGREMFGGDRVQKWLRVVVEGVQKTKVQTFILNPSAKGGSDGKQVIQVDKVELNSLVPNSKPETVINIRGSLLADTIDNSISDDSLASLIRMPGGCVEQNLASITLPLIATRYLDRSNDWQSVGVQRREEAIKYIKRGYENQLVYRKSDNSYPPYRKEGASTWITAYVVKVFSMARSIIELDEQHVCGPLLYLLNNKQKSSGAFREDNAVYTTSMTGGVRGTESETTLTAFVFIALSEAKAAGLQCNGDGVSMQSGIQKAADYLRRMLPKLRRPYSVAITAYAMSLTDKTNVFMHQLRKSATPDHTHWPDSDNSLFTLEATGYALLAMVKSGHMGEAAAPFRWLNEQRRRGGGYGSTQPTMVVLQALSDYLIQKPPPQDLSLAVDLKIAGRRDQRFVFSNNAYLARSENAPLDQSFVVEAKGKGQGILEVVTFYNELPDVHEKSSCTRFYLAVTITESSEKPPPDAEKSYKLNIDVRALGPGEVRMVVLDISLPTGFVPENADLEMLTNSVDRYISNFQVVDNLSDRGSLIIHLFRVSNKQTETINFRLHQTFKVGLLQPSSVTVYEYYNPDHSCTRFYSPKEEREELTKICTNNVCRCTQGDCCVSKTDSQSFPPGTRETYACTGLHHVYKVKVLSVSQSQYDKYEMEITQPIKLGKEQGVLAGQTRSFLSHAGCREGLNLKKGGEYLIMGIKTDVWHNDGSTNKAVYMLGKNTWVERFPMAEECASSLQSKCSELTTFANTFSVSGCRS